MEKFINDQYRKVDEMDFEGQRLSERIYFYVLLAVTLVAFVVGYTLADMKLATYIVLAATAVIMVVVGIAWPCFNRHPIKFLGRF